MRSWSRSRRTPPTCAWATAARAAGWPPSPSARGSRSRSPRRLRRSPAWSTSPTTPSAPTPTSSPPRSRAPEAHPDVERTEDYVSRTYSLSGLQRQRRDRFGRRAKLMRAIGADRVGSELEHPAQELRVVDSAGVDAQSSVPKHPDQSLGEQEVLDRDPVHSVPELSLIHI